MLDVKEKSRQLMQLRYLKGEVLQLTQRIDSLGAELKGEGVTADYRAQVTAQRDRLILRRGRCMEQLEALYGFIDGIDDSRLRQIMACRYVDGMTWRQVAARIGERDEQYPRRLHNRCLERRELPGALAGGLCVQTGKTACPERLGGL